MKPRLRNSYMLRYLRMDLYPIVSCIRIVDEKNSLKNKNVRDYELCLVRCFMVEACLNNKGGVGDRPIAKTSGSSPNSS